MPDPRTLLATLRRPRLLMRAARFGMTDYRRERDLRRYVDRTGLARRDGKLADVGRGTGWRRRGVAGDAGLFGGASHRGADRDSWPKRSSCAAAGVA